MSAVDTGATHNEVMLVPIWRTEFDIDCLEELNEFAKARSSAMFESFAGCMGHMFSHRDSTYVTISMWIGHHAIRQAEASDIYRETVDALSSTGILRGAQEIEVLDIDALNLGWESRRDAGDG